MLRIHFMQQWFGLSDFATEEALHDALVYREFAGWEVGREALLFLIPGSGTTLRVNGQAKLSVDSGLCDSFAVEGSAPRCVIELKIEEIYFQCARAIVRSKLWDVASQSDPGALPTPGQILAEMTRGEVGGAAYDQAWPERAAKTLW